MFGPMRGALTQRQTKYWIGAVTVFCALVLGWTVLQPIAIAPQQSDERATCPPLPADHRSAKPGMVWVPPGQFLIGGQRYPEEGPRLTRTVHGFWMDRSEVTNAQFAEFTKATGYVTRAEKPVDVQSYPNLPADMQKPGAVVFSAPKDLRQATKPMQWWKYQAGANWRHPQGPGSDLAGMENHPVVAVTFEDALAYAQWRGHDLPTEAEWEWAARAGQMAEDFSTEAPAAANTWQGMFPINNLREDGFAGTAPVGCFAANAYGLFDMIGNVWELTRDVYLPFHAPLTSEDTKPAGLAAFAAQSPLQHVIKGGSYLCAQNYCMRYRAAARQGQEDDLAAGHVGFRTVLR